MLYIVLQKILSSKLNGQNQFGIQLLGQMELSRSKNTNEVEPPKAK